MPKFCPAGRPKLTPPPIKVKPLISNRGKKRFAFCKEENSSSLKRVKLKRASLRSTGEIVRIYVRVAAELNGLNDVSSNGRPVGDPAKFSSLVKYVLMAN